jgi:hypothetical protein
MSRSAFNEGVVFFAHRRDGLIHELGNAVRGVTTEKFAQGPAVDLAARCSKPLREVFGLRKHFVRNGYGNFHTSSITANPAWLSTLLNCLGTKHYGAPRQREKRLLIFDTEQYRYQKFISDLAGMGIHAHGAEPETAFIETAIG